MNRYPLRLSALAIGVAMVVVTYSLVKPPAPWVAAHPAPTGQPTTLTIDAVYQRVQQAISRPGLLYQATIRETSQQDGAHTTTTVQWVDAGHNVAREDVKSVDPNGEQSSQTDLLTPQGYYQRDPLGQVTAMSSRSMTCPGATLSVSVVLGLAHAGCPGTRMPVPGSGTVRTWTVRRGQYAGRPAIVLLRTDTWRNGRQQVTFTIRLSLDAHTFLPLARESGGQLSSGRVLQKPDRVIFAHRFITASSVSAGFFDPAALGYVPPNPEVPLNESPPGFTVYWLGVHFAGAAGLPPLLLGKVEGPTEGSYFRFTLSYMPPDDPFGSAVVELQEWPRVNWAAHSGYQTSQELSGPCWHREDLALQHGRAQLFLGFAYAGRAKPCPRRPYTLSIAHVFLGQTVIHVAVS